MRRLDRGSLGKVLLGRVLLGEVRPGCCKVLRPFLFGECGGKLISDLIPRRRRVIYYWRASPAEGVN